MRVIGAEGKEKEGALRMKSKWTAGILAGALLLFGVHSGGLQANAAPEAKASSLAGAVRGESGQLLLEVATAAGSGEPSLKNGEARLSAFRSPQGMISLPDGTVYIADTDNHQLRKLADGNVTTIAGLSIYTDEHDRPTGAYNDGSASEAAFNGPVGLAADSAGNLYVADSGNHAIRKLSPEGTWTTLAGNGVLGSRDGNGEQAQFHNPQAIVLDEAGNVYVADALNHAIRKVTPEGAVTTLNAREEGGTEVMPGLLVESGGYRDGALVQALFNEPSGLALDAKGNLYVSDTGNQLIRYIDLAKGIVTTVAGSAANGKVVPADNSLYAASGFRDGKATEALFNFPRGLAVTPEGGLLIADSMNHAVRYLLNEEVVTLAGGEDAERGWEDGIEGQHGLHLPTAVALGIDGSVLVADAYNNRIRAIRLQQLADRQAGEVSVRIVTGTEGKPLNTAAELQKGRTLAPVRAVAEALGYQVSYDPASREALLESEGIKVTLKQDERTAVVSRDGGEAIVHELDAAPFTQKGTIYIPVRYMSELIGLDVQWHAESKTVIIRGAEAGIGGE